MGEGATGAGRRPDPSPPSRCALGQEGERLAADYLANLGYRILERNYRWRGGEIDLVARDGEVLVFVEVRSRRSASFGAPYETVTRSKQRRIARTAEHWLVTHDAVHDPARFDVVSVVMPAGRAPEIELVQGAFEV